MILTYKNTVYSVFCRRRNYSIEGEFVVREKEIKFFGQYYSNYSPISILYNDSTLEINLPKNKSTESIINSVINLVEEFKQKHLTTA